MPAFGSQRRAGGQSRSWSGPARACAGVANENGGSPSLSAHGWERPKSVETEIKYAGYLDQHHKSDRALEKAGSDDPTWSITEPSVDSPRDAGKTGTGFVPARSSSQRNPGRPHRLPWPWLTCLSKSQLASSLHKSRRLPSMLWCQWCIDSATNGEGQTNHCCEDAPAVVSSATCPQSVLGKH